MSKNSLWESFVCRGLCPVSTVLIPGKSVAGEVPGVRGRVCEKSHRGNTQGVVVNVPSNRLNIEERKLHFEERRQSARRRHREVDHVLRLVEESKSSSL